MPCNFNPVFCNGYILCYYSTISKPGYQNIKSVKTYVDVCNSTTVRKKTISLPQIYTCAFNDSIQVPAQYILNFQEYFGHELSTKLPRYDLLGYDLTLHLLHMLQQAHITSNNTLPTDIIWNGTLTDIQYKKVAPQGGYENQTIHIIRK